MAGEHGPFNSLQEAEATPAVRAIYGKVRDPGSPPGLLRKLSSALILEACEAAGVELGDQDRRTIAWLGAVPVPGNRRADLAGGGREGKRCRLGR